MELLQDQIIQFAVLVVATIIARVIFVASQAIRNDARVRFFDKAFDILTTTIIDAIISAEHGDASLERYKEKAIESNRNYKMLFVLDVAQDVAKQLGLRISSDTLYSMIESAFQDLNKNATVNGKRLDTV